MKARRFLALVVTALMLLTSFALPGPMSAVREAEALTMDAPELIAPAAEAPAEKDDDIEYEGWCGPNLYWEYYPYTRELVITGSGYMYSYWENDNPWCENDFAAQVLTVSLPKGITDIGTYAFYGLTALKEITLPSTVKSIEESAFEECTALRSITLPKSVKTIGPWAFYDCGSLKDVYYLGKAEDGVKVAIQYGNSNLLNATWHYSKPNTTTLAIKTQPKNTKVDEGKTAVFKAKAAGAKVIKWQYQEPTDTAWYDWGITGESISVLGTTLYDGYRFRVAVTNGSTTLYSSPATLTVKPVTLAIKSQPKAVVKVDEYKSFTVKVKAAGAIHYTWWYKYADEDSWYYWQSDMDTFTMSAYAEWTDGMLIYCVVSNDRGDEITSNITTVKVNIKITEKPKSVKVYAGEFATFSVDGTGYTGVQWEYQWPGDKYWYDVGGGTYDIIDIPVYDTDYSGLKFRCRLYNNTSYKYTSAVKLTVTESPNPKGANRALLVGENWYDSSPLYGCMNDMYAMEGMLQGLGNKFSTRILPNSSWSEIINAIRTSFKGTNSKSVSLFYYSGHGLSYSESSYYHGALCSIDGGYITFDDLAYELSKVNGRVIVILDSCFSGAAINKATGSTVDMDKFLTDYNNAAIAAFSGYYMTEDGGVTKDKSTKSGELATSKFIVLTASTKTETSHDYYFDGSGYRQGQFTAALIKNMGCYYPNGTYSGYTPADKNSDKQITLSEIYYSTYNTALAWDNSQHAKCYGNMSEVLFRRK